MGIMGSTQICLVLPSLRSFGCVWPEFVLPQYEVQQRFCSYASPPLPFLAHESKYAHKVPNGPFFFPKKNESATINKATSAFEARKHED
uniref:Uncharacterized protein n=1 Tax=Rhipicephalus zambeziensis TaxID=60191 RepID=A0A224YLC2_9ACAR